MTKIEAFILKVCLILSFEMQGILSLDENEDPIVGLGILTPIIRTVNHVVTAPIRNQARFARNRKNKMRHRHLLGSANPFELDGSIMDGCELTQFENSNFAAHSDERIANNKRDEDLYLWSLNNWVPYTRTYERSTDPIVIDNIYAYNQEMYQHQPEVDVQLLASPSFYRGFEVIPSDKDMRNIIPTSNGIDRFNDAPRIEIDPAIFLDNLDSTNEENQQGCDYFGNYNHGNPDRNHNVENNAYEELSQQTEEVVPHHSNDYSSYNSQVEPSKIKLEEYNCNHENGVVPAEFYQHSITDPQQNEHGASVVNKEPSLYDTDPKYGSNQKSFVIHGENDYYAHNLQESTKYKYPDNNPNIAEDNLNDDVYHETKPNNKNAREALNNQLNYKSAEPRHFHSSTFKKWFSTDKPIFTDSSSSWEYHNQPPIVINNHNVPVNVNNHNSQFAQTSGHSSSSQSQAVAHLSSSHQNNQVADTSDHSSTSQSQAVANRFDLNNKNFQGGEIMPGSTSTQLQTIISAPSALFDLSTNAQAAKTVEGSTSNQAQTITGSAGLNNQLSVTSGGSQSSQSQTVARQRLLRIPSPYLVDIQPYRQPSRKYYRKKRSLPLVRLITDPNAKLDMPKTLENFGTVARNSFQDKRQPMYHMKNMVGSARDVFLSALRVPPQGIVIPSQYKIIDTKKERAIPINDYTYLDNIVDKVKSIPDEAKQFIEPIVGSNSSPPPLQRMPQTVREKIQERINNLRNSLGSKVKSRSVLFDDPPYFRGKTSVDDDNQFAETFQKMGNIFRDSIKSGQQTLNHITDVAHSARKAFTTSTVGAPRVVRPLMHAPAFEKKQFLLRNDPEKVTFVAPRFLDVTNEGKPKETSNDFIDVGDIMNAFGVSNPSGRKVGLRRYVVHSKVDKTAPQESMGPMVGNRFGESNEITKDGPPRKKFFVVAEDIDDNDIVSNEIDIIKDLTDVLGVNSLQDLLSGMKTDLTYMKDKVIENKYKELEALQMKLLKIDTNKLPQGDQMQLLDDKISSDEDIDQFIKSLFPPEEKLSSQRSRRQLNQHHHGLALPANLLRPFMGSPSRIELNNYFRRHGDFEEVLNDSAEDLTSLQSQQDEFVEALFNPNEYISAINPTMYLKMFNEPIAFQDKYPKLGDKKTIKDMVKNHNFDLVGDAQNGEVNQNGRFSMKVKDKLLKPYMGKTDKGYYHTYMDYVPDFGYLPNSYHGYNVNKHYDSDSSDEYNNDSDEFYY